MPDLSVVMRKSRVFYDRSGECWLLLHVPEGADTGGLCSTLWQEYCKYLEEAYADISGPDALGSGGSSGRDRNSFSAVSR